MSMGLPGSGKSIFFGVESLCDGMVDISIISLNRHKTGLLESSISLIFLGEEKQKDTSCTMLFLKTKDYL